MSNPTPRLLLVDSREQWTQPKRREDNHIKSYLERHGVPYKVLRLDVGDYTFEGSNIVVDRKMGLLEVARNLTNKSDSSRFWREVRRAYKSGLKLVILVESGPSVLSINDVPNWSSEYTKVTGRAIQREMLRLELAYGVRWQFCSKRSTAKRIIEILTEGSQLKI